MAELSSKAQKGLKKYLRELKKSLKKRGAYSKEAIADIEQHIRRDLESYPNASEIDLQSILDKLGAPEVVAKSIPQNTEVKKPTVGRRIVKWSLIVIAAMFGLVGISLAGGIIWVYFTVKDLKKPTEVLSEAKVLTGAKYIGREYFIENPSVGKVTDIVFRNLDGKAGKEIGIVGQNGAIFVNQDGNISHKVSFPARANAKAKARAKKANVVFVDFNSDAKTEFFDRGGGLSPVSLFSHDGKLIWEYVGSDSMFVGVADAAYGDMDGDGSLEIGVGFNGSYGVHLLNSDGEKLWAKEGVNIWHLEMLDTNGDGLAELLHSDAKGQLWVRNRLGEEVRRTKPLGYFAEFTIGSWLSAQAIDSIIYLDKSLVRIIDFSGREIDTYSVPEFDTQGEVLVASGDIDGDGEREIFLAIKQGLGKSSLLILLNKKKERLFAAIIGADVGALCVIPGLKKDRFLVGVGTQVREYFLAE